MIKGFELWSSESPCYAQLDFKQGCDGWHVKVPAVPIGWRKSGDITDAFVIPSTFKVNISMFPKW